MFFQPRDAAEPPAVEVGLAGQWPRAAAEPFVAGAPAQASEGRSRPVARTAPRTMVFNRPSAGRVSHECVFCFYSQTFWETSTQENLALEASDRSETRLELLTRLSSIRFFPTFSSRVELSKVPTINSVAFRGYCSTVAEQPEDYTRIY